MSVCGLALVLAAVLGASGAEAGLRVEHNAAEQQVDVFDGAQPVLRFNHGSTAKPAGLAEDESAHGNYVSRLYGPNGELLTEDYPEDHPHHRAVYWAWATVEWRGETRDLFWGKGLWARPVEMKRAVVEEGAAVLEMTSVWKWDDQEPIVDEAVRIDVGPWQDGGRVIDFDISLTPIVEGLRYCGRLEAGYSGFVVRMAPGEGQEIGFHIGPAEAAPRRAWADYSAEFSGGAGRAGVAIVQHAGNPGYPHEWREYPTLNYFQPIFPGGELVPMPKGETAKLRYRLYVHAGKVGEAALARQWDLFNTAAE